jgi:hypothetical protein
MTDMKQFWRAERESIFAEQRGRLMLESLSYRRSSLFIGGHSFSFKIE